jgi:tetratricopeptide (TPR) repeat protein
MKRVFAVAIVAFVSFGCGGVVREAAWGEHAPVVAAPAGLGPHAREQRAGFMAQADAAWAQRGDLPRLRAAIQAWKNALVLDPTREQDWAMLSRAYYFLADAHLSFEDGKRTEMLAAYHDGALAAEQGLLQSSPTFASRMREGSTIEDQLTLLDTRDVPCLFWRAMNLNRWATVQGGGTLRTYGPEARAMMARVLDLNANYFYGGPYRFFGDIYARWAPAAGGDIVRARANFEAALRVAPNYLASRVLIAEDYAIKARAREVFDQQLHAVLFSQGHTDPELGPENAAEQRRARKLVENARTLFR